MLINIKNRDGYSETIPRKRVLTVLLNFDVAVLLYIITDLIVGKTLSLDQIILSFIAWDSVGNSNWYIFTIIMLYLITYISSKRYGYSRRCVITVCALVVIYTVIMSVLKATWWYDTTFAFAFGAVYCYKREWFNSSLKRYDTSMLIGLTSIFVLLHFAPNIIGVFVNVRSIILSLIILLLSMKIPLSNKFLAWSGKNLFPLYIYQRLPMLILSIVSIGSVNLLEVVPYLYIGMATIFTLRIAYLHKYLAIKF